MLILGQDSVRICERERESKEMMIIPIKCSIVENKYKWFKRKMSHLPEEYASHQSSQHLVHGAEEFPSPNLQTSEYV